MCPFYNAQLFEITGAAKGVFTYSQSSCHIAKVVLAIRHDSRQIPLATIIRSPIAVSLYGAFFVKEFAGAVKVGRRAHLAACSELARPYLDSSEHDDTLGAVGMTIRGEPAFGHGSS